MSYYITRIIPNFLFSGTLSSSMTSLIDCFIHGQYKLVMVLLRSPKRLSVEVVVWVHDFGIQTGLVFQ